ncbi:hypothetical protein CPB86DRAFT_817209 [Serendipita vermifera]|nr:hypothetical protein CPB86DRAFT_817209 [Serendipita vermifera]
MPPPFRALRPFLPLSAAKFFIAVVSAACIVSFIAITSYLLAKPSTIKPSALVPYPAEISFSIEYILADPLTRVFVMDWTIETWRGCGATIVADIYLDRGYLDPSSPSFTPGPVYTFNKTAACAGEAESRPGFRTISKLLSAPQGELTVSTIQRYPFDAYIIMFGVQAIDNATSAGMPMNITRSFGFATNFDVTLQKSAMFGGNNPRLNVILQVKRTTPIKFFVLITSFANWLIALAVLVVTIATIVYPPHEIYAEIFVVPVGALFACTSVRTNLPGAPSGFGWLFPFLLHYFQLN